MLIVVLGVGAGGGDTSVSARKEVVAREPLANAFKTMR